MPRLPHEDSFSDADIPYEFVDEFDELLEIAEIDDEPMSVAAHEVGAWTEERAVD